MNIRRLATLLALESALVERATSGAAPSAFRIYAAGKNDSDDGAVFFTKESAKLLIAEQEARGRQYSIDFDHLSLQTARPAEAGRAAGYHRLEVRADANGEPELWAAEIEWCVDVKAGLEEQPPRWKFFSPAFLTRVEGKGQEARDTGEIVSYINFAICINPKTHGLPALAAVTPTKKKAATAVTKGTGPMDPEKCKAAMQAMIDGEEDGEKKEALTAAMKLAFPPEDDEETKKKKEEAAKKAAADDEAAKKQAADTEEAAKKEAATRAAAATAAIDANVKLAIETQLRAIDDAKEKRAAIDKEVAERDLPATVKEWCASQSIEVARSFLDKAPKKMAQRNTTVARGNDGAVGEGGLQGAELEEYERAKGTHMNAFSGPTRRDDGTFVLPTMGPREYAAAQAAKKGQV